MKSLHVADIVSGMRLDRAVVSPKGQILLNAGTVLSSAHVGKLNSWGVTYIYVEDTSDERSEESEGTRQSASESENDFTGASKGFPEEYGKTVSEMKALFVKSGWTKAAPMSSLKGLIDRTVASIVRTGWALHYLHELRQRSDSTFAHSINVAAVAGAIGTWLSYSPSDREKLMLTGLLHDLGKLFIPVMILDKPGSLSAMEFEVIKKHSQDGYQLLKYSDLVPREVKLGILQHHERLDGSGYPFGFRGNEVHHFARIVAIADMYDAMVSEKVYRRKMSASAALSIIRGESNSKLDSGICLVFLKNMPLFLGNGDEFIL